MPGSDSSTAILSVLRKPGDEVQLTQLLAAVAKDDEEVAGHLARVLVRAAPHAGQREALGDVPARLRCRAEATLNAPGHDDHGRVDLRFDDGARDFTLLAELKLHSGYGDDQIRRYHDALDDLPEDRRAAVVAVTRNVPGVGEPAADTARWLGSLRWTEIYEELLKLPIKDRELGAQWRLLLRIIDEQGDFGVKELDRNEVAGWAAYVRTREKLERLVEDLAPKALERLQELLAQRVAWEGTPKEKTADLSRRGKEMKIPYPTQKTVQARFLIPSNGGQERLRIQFLGGFDEPLFTVEARRYGASTLLAGKAPGSEKFVAAVNSLANADHPFQTDDRSYVSHVHGPDSWLEPSDGKGIGDALLDLVTEDLKLLCGSGILDPDSGFEADVGRIDDTDEEAADEP